MQGRNRQTQRKTSNNVQIRFHSHLFKTKISLPAPNERRRCLAITHRQSRSFQLRYQFQCQATKKDMEVNKQALRWRKDFEQLIPCLCPSLLQTHTPLLYGLNRCSPRLQECICRSQLHKEENKECPVHNNIPEEQYVRVGWQTGGSLQNIRPDQDNIHHSVVGLEETQIVWSQGKSGS